jgi:hypothetical protein
MSVEYVRVRIGGSPESVGELLAGLPGDHRPQHQGGSIYLVATTDAGFLRFAIEHQGYGEVIGE